MHEKFEIGIAAQRKNQGHLENYHGKSEDLFNPFTLE